MAEHSTAHAHHNSVDAAKTGGEPAEPISFADVVRMTHERSCEPDPLLQALRTSPERTRKV